MHCAALWRNTAPIPRVMRPVPPSFPLPNEVLRATKQIFYFVSSTSFPFLRLTNPSRVSSRRSGLPRQQKGDRDLEIQKKICWTEFIFVTTEHCAAFCSSFAGPTLIRSGPGSSVSTVTGYGMDGSGIKSRLGSRFYAPVKNRLWVPPSHLYNGYRVFPGNRGGRGVGLTPTPI